MAASFDAVRRFRTPAYLLFVLSMILPVVELILAVSPVKPTNVMWRFGAVGLFSSAVAAPMLMLLLIYGVALVSEDRRVLYVIGTLAALASIILVVAAGGFTLDALQMKRQVAAGAMTKFAVASIQAFIKMILEAIAGAVLAVYAFRAARALKREVAKPTRGSTLVVGQPAKPRPAEAPALEPKANG